MTQDVKDFSKIRENRYLETFNSVIDEAKELGLINVEKNSNLLLVEKGLELIGLYEKGESQSFNYALFELMENKYNVFRTLIEFLYSANIYKPGLLVFPSYSPLQLGIEKEKIKTTRDILNYSQLLIEKIEHDIKLYLDQNRQLTEFTSKIIKNLQDDKLLNMDLDFPFDPNRYNAIIKRFRDYWISYFLKEVYKSEVSWSTFERWVYRGKQIGIIHATEFYPNFNGKIIYPTSVITSLSKNDDFKLIHNYDDVKGFFIHNPSWSNIKDAFIKCLVESYFELRHIYRYRGRFISLHALREIVCYKIKISEYTFHEFLDYTYKLNLSGELTIKISLEVDKLPEETKVMYLTREPVMVDGKYRNIISIDVTKEERP